MMKKRVLVFPCGSEIGLEVYRALEFSKDFEVFGGSSVDDHGKFIYSNYIPDIPFVDDEDFISKINDIVEKNKIDLIIPAHDSVVLKLAQNLVNVKAIVVSSDLYACEICRSKKKTYKLFNEIILVPEVYEKNDKNLKFPLFLKPDVGQGSKGTKKVNNIEELNFYCTSEDIMILEYLPNDEYTIDCFTDYNGNLTYCSGRKRNRISNGISVNSITENDERFIELAKKINSVLKMNGAWFFQLKKRDNDELVLLEIAPRIAGAMEFQRAYGVNLPLLSLYNALKINVSIVKNKYDVEMDRALSSKFKISYNYDKIYLDLDDTLIFEDKVNYKLLSFLYKSINDGKKIVLITRHKNNILDTLNKFKIGFIFDEIIHLKEDEYKSKYIKSEEKAIFIDDSHRERKDVYDIVNIPVFDVNMIDILF